MTHHLSIDLETYSSVDLKKAGAQAYIRSPDFEILLFAFSLDGNPVRVIDMAQGEEIPAEILNALVSPEYLKHAYNAAFEWGCLSRYTGRMLPPSQWRDTMLHGLYCGYTAGLEATGRALGIPEDKQKLNTGKALIRYFCVPCKPTKANGGRTRNYPHHDPDKWRLFKTYNGQDVEAEMEIERFLSAFPVPAEVQKQWETDLVINARGVAVDMDFVHGALEMGETVRTELTDEAVRISGLYNPNSVRQLSQWLSDETGEEVSNLRKETVAVMASTGAKYATSYLWKGTYWSGEYNLVGSDHSDSSYGYVPSTNSITAAEILLAGFDFSSLPSNAIITGYTLRTRGRRYSSGTSYTTRIFYQLAGDPVATNKTTGTYTGLGNSIYFVNGILTNTNYSDYSHTSDSNDSAVISWMNSNINKLKNGSFGVSFNAVNARIPYVSLELTYETPYSISTGVSPAGSGSVSGGGSYISGSSATLTASPSTGYHFVQWQDGNTSASRTITVSGDATYTAYFAINSYTVSTAVSPSGGGSVSGGGTYNYGSTATLTATPSTGYRFGRWSDNVTTATRTVTVAGAATYTAVFELLSYTVNATVSPAGGGTVSGTGTYTHGSTATLIATAGTGYEFVKWSDDNTSEQRSFVVTSAVSLTAIFQLKTYTIYLRDEDDNSLGSVTAQYGSSPQITTTPTKAPSGGYTYTFREWNTQRDGSGASYTLNGLPAAYASTTYYALFDAVASNQPIASVSFAPNPATSGQGVVVTVTF